jgi:hypothetical protein
VKWIWRRLRLSLLKEFLSDSISVKNYLGS